MKLKSDYIKENAYLRAKIVSIIAIPCNQKLFSCPNFGNPVLINDGAHSQRISHSRTFYCSVGHQFTFSN